MGQSIKAGLMIAAAALAFVLGGASTLTPIKLVAQPALSRRADAMPRIGGVLTAQDKKINAALARADARLRKADAQCGEGAASMEQHGSWDRAVSAPMRGPGFLSLVASDGYSCGGAHPEDGVLALTYDLATGAPLDWATVLPAALSMPQERSTASDGTVVGVVTAPALVAWYRKAAVAALPADLKEDCKDVLETSSGSLILWADAKRGGVAVKSTDLPHVVAVCSVDVVMPLAELRKRGASKRLTDAIEAAHKAHAWTEGF